MSEKRLYDRIEAEGPIRWATAVSEGLDNEQSASVVPSPLLTTKPTSVDAAKGRVDNSDVNQTSRARPSHPHSEAQASHGRLRKYLPLLPPGRLPVEIWAQINSHLVPLGTHVRIFGWKPEPVQTTISLGFPRYADTALAAIYEPVYRTMHAHTSTNFLWTHGQREFWRAALPRIHWAIACDEVRDECAVMQDIERLEKMVQDEGCFVRQLTLLIGPPLRWDEVNGSVAGFRRIFAQVPAVIQHLSNTQKKRQAPTSLQVRLITQQMRVEGEEEEWWDWEEYADVFYDACRALGPQMGDVVRWKDACRKGEVDLKMTLSDHRDIVERTEGTKLRFLRQVAHEERDLTDFFDDLDTLHDELLEGVIEEDDDEVTLLVQKATVRRNIWNELAKAEATGTNRVRRLLRLYEDSFPHFYHARIRPKYAKYLDHKVEV